MLVGAALVNIRLQRTLNNMKLKPGNIIFNMLAIITVAAVLFVGFNIFSGARGYAVVTDSMAPTLNRGDVVFVQQAEFETLKEGDIVTVCFADGSGFFTHKIVSIDHFAGAIRTKGDANESEDPQASMSEQIMGRMWYSVPYLGYFSIAVNEMNIITISVILAVVLIIITGASVLVSKFSKKRGGKNE